MRDAEIVCTGLNTIYVIRRSSSTARALTVLSEFVLRKNLKNNAYPVNSDPLLAGIIGEELIVSLAVHKKHVDGE